MTSNRYGFRGDRMKDSQGYIKFDDYAALAAENERLRKAGDELYKWAGSESRPPMKVYAAWNAAKEGRDAK